MLHGNFGWFSHLSWLLYSEYRNKKNLWCKV